MTDEDNPGDTWKAFSGQGSGTVDCVEVHDNESGDCKGESFARYVYKRAATRSPLSRTSQLRTYRPNLILSRGTVHTDKRGLSIAVRTVCHGC